MSRNDGATERMIDKYRGLVLDFVDGRVSAEDFETSFLQVFKTDSDQVPGREFDILEKLFFAIDDFVADSELRKQVGGLDGDELRARAEDTYAQLYGA